MADGASAGGPGLLGPPYADAVRVLERDDELERLRGALAQARSGQGSGLALTGESGAGKSTLVHAACAEAAGLRVLRGQCEPLSTPRPLGPFRDLGLAGLGSVQSLDDDVDLRDRLVDELRSEPTVLVVEDLHWLDDASADLLRFVARRVETLPVALVVTYRDLEIGPRHAARKLLGDFAALDGLDTLSLAPLSESAVRQAVEGTDLDPVRVHRLTGGNAFFVAQVVKDPERPLPTTVRDAVLARIDDVSLDDLEILQLIASAPDRLDDRVLPLVGVDLPTLRRLDGTALLDRTDRGLVFRHELVRLALESTIPPGGAPRLHARLLDALERIEPRDPAVLTHHAVAARDAARTLAHARAAADEAVASASNREAAAFLEVALAHLPSTAPVAERAALLAQLGGQQYLAGQHRNALASARASIPLWEAAGEPAGVAEAYAGLAVLEYQTVGRRRYSVDYIQRAMELADESGVPSAIARAYTDAATLAVIASELTEAKAFGERLLAVAEEAGLEEFVVAGRMLLAAVTCVVGDRDARAEVLRWTEEARQHGWDELAWRGYVFVFIYDYERGNMRDAFRVFDETVTFVTDRDLPAARNWHLSFRGLAHVVMGRWSAAEEDARAALADTELGGNPWPHLTLGQVAMRCGREGAAEHLDRAWEVVTGIDEPLRWFPVLSALAEQMWLTGRADHRVTSFGVERLLSMSTSPDTTWASGMFCTWLRRLGVAFEEPAVVGEPFRMLLDGRHSEAAAWWRLSGDAFLEAMALADSPREEDRVRAVTLLDKLGAIGTADRLRVDLRQDGVGAVPQRPRETTRANPGGLTNRQLDVARLLARGLTNSEIAGQLYISPKTADHHVSAVLAKLDLPNRRAVALHAAELGLD